MGGISHNCSRHRAFLFSSNLSLCMGYPGDSAGEESACNEGDLSSIPGLGISPDGGHHNPLLYTCLENPHGQRSLVDYSPWGRKESDTTERLSPAQHIIVYKPLQTPRWLRGKKYACNARVTGDTGLIPVSENPLEGYPLEKSCLENPMDRGAWWAGFGITKRRA